MEEDGQHIEHQHLISITQHVRDVYIICLLLLSFKRTINVQNRHRLPHSTFMYEDTWCCLQHFNFPSRSMVESIA